MKFESLVSRRSLLFFAALAGACATAIQPYRPVVIVGMSMEPSLRNHQVKVAVRNFHNLQRGQIVVFRHNGEELVKRVALLPGDHVTAYWSEGAWSFPVNRVDKYTYEQSLAPRKDFVVPPKSVFVLGDNWHQSVDSRSFGVIPVDAIGGVILDSTKSGPDLLGVRFGTLRCL